MSQSGPKLRQSNLERLRGRSFDVLVVGGGINGAVCAAALASRGASVALIDRGDFAGVTSQESSNLAWGGIKYMENFDFRLVRKLCMSRNRLIRSYPSTVREIRFLTTIERGFRWHPLLLWMGTWLYWLIGNCFTRVPRLYSKGAMARSEPVIELENSAGGFEYSDAYLHDNDARFVFGFVRTALNRGCIAVNYVESLGGKRGEDGWVTPVRDTRSGEEFEVRSRVLINAAGVYVDQHNELCAVQAQYRHLFSKGIHLIVDRVTPRRRVLAFFADDGRLFFAIPMGPRTCIGTTDTRVDAPEVEVTAADRAFVLDNINKRLKLSRPLSEEDIVAERCGVRPLAVAGEAGKDEDFLQLSRKHVIEVDHEQAHLSVFGGKLTDCINVGEEICDEVGKLGVKLSFPDFRWYGEPADDVRDEFLHQASLMDLDAYTAEESSEPLTTRYWRRYGAQAMHLLENIREDPAAAEVLIRGTEYTRCELKLAARREMIVTLEDFLRRRSKIALVERAEVIHAAPGLAEACQILFGDQAEQRIDEYFKS